MCDRNNLTIYHISILIDFCVFEVSPSKNYIKLAQFSKQEIINS